MKWEWAVYTGYFPDPICDLILANGLKAPAQQGAVGNGKGHGVNNKIRKSDVRFIPQNQSWQWLFDVLWKLAWDANRNFGFELSQLGFLQLAEYKAENKGHYHRHQDVFWVTEQPLHRKLSCVIQLSNPADYEGGNLELETGQKPLVDSMRARGSVIFFPSFTHHAALPVTKGIRHSIAAWFEGPKWR